ncbi:MAG: hypothetical protein R3Y63_00625 [Eubacteriales bacterium]
METLIDLVIVIFIPIMMYRGYRRGGILTLMTFFTLFVAFHGAVFLSTNLAEPVGRFIQPIVKDVITDVLEDALKFENIVIEAPSNTNEIEEEESTTTQEYLTMARAFQILIKSQDLAKIEGFIDKARTELLTGAQEQIGSVTDGISSVIGLEIARVVTFSLSFSVLFIFWLLLTRAINIVFKIPGLAQVNAISGACIGLFLALMLVYVFAWITPGGIIPWSDVEKTLLFEYFAKKNPLELLAPNYQVELDI